MSQSRSKSLKTLAGDDNDSDVVSEIDSLDSEAELKHLGEEFFII